MTNFTIFINTFLAICGGVGIVGGAGAVIFKVVRPAMALRERVDELDVRCNELTNNLEELTKNTQILLKCTLCLLDSDLNKSENINKMKDELQNYLIQK